MDTAPAPAKAKKAGMVKAKEESEEEEDDDDEDDDDEEDEEEEEEGEFMEWLQIMDHRLDPIHRICGGEAEISGSTGTSAVMYSYRILDYAGQCP